MLRTQVFRQLAVSTPLGDDVLLLRGFTGQQELGQPFEYELDLLSEEPDIPFEDIVGQNVTVRIQRSVDEEPAYLNGFVSSFELVEPLDGTTACRATVVPWLWFLTRTSDCRIFQEMTVPDIIKQVFRDYGFCDFEDRLSRTYRTWEYCVQYCETAFDFVNRLMEEEGIYYFFVHEDGKHTLVLADDPAAHDTVSEYEEIQYRPPTGSIRDREYIHTWRMRHKVQPGAYTHTDFDFKNPRKALQAASTMTRPDAAADYEIFDYPVEYVEVADGEAYARQRMEAYQAQYEVAEGAGEVRGIATGFKFKLAEHPRDDQCKEYLVTSVRVEASSDQFGSGSLLASVANVAGIAGGAGGLNFTVSFKAIAATQVFRRRCVTRRPRIRGPQTATVVGPEGEEIHTDDYGRVKVQFHWDRYGQYDPNSSCWVRVAQFWAGKRWGATFIPRIGQEVVVVFLEGNPSRPIIIGSVYNGVQMPPYLGDGLDSKHKHDPNLSGIKTCSTPGGDGYNEIRFDDTKGSEQLFLHAQSSMDVRVRGSARESVGSSKHLTVGGQDENGETYGDYRQKVFGIKETYVMSDCLATVLENEKRLCAGDLTRVTYGKTLEYTESGGHYLQAKPNVFVEAQPSDDGAPAEICLKVGASFIKMTAEGIWIQAPNVFINCDEEAPESESEPELDDPTEPDGADSSKSGSPSCGSNGS